MDRPDDRGMDPPGSVRNGHNRRLEALQSSDAVQTAFLESDHHESNEHIALIYDTRAEQFAAVIPFIRQGLKRGEKCLYVVDDNSKADLFEAMRAEGVDVATVRESGALTVLTGEAYVHNDEFSPDGQLAFLAEAIQDATEEYPAARVAVEMTCFLEDDLDFEELIAYEERYNTLSVDADAIAMCQYNSERFPDAIIRDTVRAHPHLIADRTLTHNVYYTPPDEFFGSDYPLHELERMITSMAALADAETELQRQNERLEEFASIVSHDLRNPLNVAQGRLELAREDNDSEHLDAVARAHERMETMIENLLTLAREGARATDVEPIDIAELADRCWQTVGTAEATLVSDIEQTIQADPGRLQQFLENLIRNGIEHGGEDVTITIGDLEEGFFIEDDGPGIPHDVRERIFEAGYSTGNDGAGFGLRIVKQVADVHSWEVDVTDSDDGGARFEVTGVEFADC